ncbi:MAG TPA: ABC transporter substrate-binding protein [Spirochaetia bacterium]|mgnify:FL=1|nr:ABC transporter substrate-binding protein [Spirochaetaceae bacterium]HPE89267.1 ABC transporter substrate-binding protein [Spirochaetales bacterium]HRW25302.1 ABC transporter substrate-binding protein [Spirochaetia bacterium]
MKRSAVLIALLALVVSFAAAQQSVSAYTTLEEPLAKALFEKFEAETGIKVNFVRLSGGEVVTRLEAERENPQASIWVGGVGLDHITAKDKGLTTPYKSRAAGKTPSEFKDKQGYWVGMYVGPLTFVTNLKRAEELGIKPPQSWADLLKPEYKGLVRVANPNTSGTAYNVITTLRYIYKGDEEKVFDYLKKLDANIDQYTRSGSAPGKSVAIGEIPIAIGYAHDQVKLKAGGAPVVITAPKEGTGYELASMSLVAGGKDAVNAKKLYDWILSSPTAQAEFVNYYLVLVTPGAAKHPDALSLKEIKTVTQDFLWDGNADNRARLLKRWTDEIGSKR